MLPEHYCDFLLALYEQGEGEDHPPQKNRPILLARSSKSLYLQIIMVIVTIGALFVMFTVSSIIASTVLAIVIAFLLIFTVANLMKKSIMAPVMYVLIALLLLGFSLKLWLLYFSDRPDVLIGIMISHCILWMIAGKYLRQIYLLISGSAGLLITMYYLFF